MADGPFDNDLLSWLRRRRNQSRNKGFIAGREMAEDILRILRAKQREKLVLIHPFIIPDLVKMVFRRKERKQNQSQAYLGLIVFSDYSTDTKKE